MARPSITNIDLFNIFLNIHDNKIIIYQQIFKYIYMGKEYRYSINKYKY